jgi:parvulin-like peptidyl-prolyl isomerase
MLAGLLLQVSLFVSPHYLADPPPESRSARALVVAFERVPGAEPGPGAYRGREEAEQLANSLAQGLRAGAEFDTLAARARSGAPGSGGGVLGTYFPGLLDPKIDQFLFGAREFEVSLPIETPTGYQVVQRIDRLAGCRGILVAGKDEAASAKFALLSKRLAAGDDFAGLAREFSDDAPSAARGGALGIFERGPADALLKAQVFRLQVGEFGVLESPLGQHLIQRVPPADIDPALQDATVARARLILISFRGARGATKPLDRTHADAEALAAELARRIRAGEDMAELAASFDDDRGGRERRGDTGWIRRGVGQVAPVLDRVFLLPLRELQDPVATDEGFLLLRRER